MGEMWGDRGGAPRDRRHATAARPPWRSPEDFEDQVLHRPRAAAPRAGPARPAARTGSEVLELLARIVGAVSRACGHPTGKAFDRILCMECRPDTCGPVMDSTPICSRLGTTLADPENLGERYSPMTATRQFIGKAPLIRPTPYRALGDI